MADRYAWTAVDGDYGTAADWSDLTTGAAPAATAPGAADSVAIAGPSDGSFDRIAGTGAAADLTLSGRSVIAAHLTTVSLTLSGGTADLVAGASLSTTTAQIGPGGGPDLTGVLQITGAGTRFSTSGLLTIAALAYAPGSGLLGAGDQASVQAGTLVLAGGTLSVDGTATIEVGSAGTAPAGSLGIDAGATLSSTAGQITGRVVVTGTLLATAGRTSLLGPVSGTGTLAIGTAGTLAVPGAVAAATTVAFTGSGGVLQLVAIGNAFAGSITGFAPGDAIDYGTGILTAASWSAGVLTLTGYKNVTTSLRLPGAYAGTSFLVRPDGNGGSLVTLPAPISNPAPVSNPAPAGTLPNGSGPVNPGAAHSYAWIGTGSGAWSNPANWTDLTAGQAIATTAPAGTDRVTVTGPTGPSPLLLTGPGGSSSLTVAGTVALAGAFTSGAVTVGGGSAPAALALVNTANLLVPSLLLTGAGSQITLVGNTTILATGGIAIGSSALLAPTESSLIRTASLVLSGGTIAMAGVARLQIGSASNLGGAALTVDAGLTLTSNGGLIIGVIALRGTLLANAGRTAIIGNVVNNGTLAIAAAATLSLTGSLAATETVSFLGPQGMLQLGPAARATAAVITGFVQGDAIDIVNLALTDATYAAGNLAPGSLAPGSLAPGSLAPGSLALGSGGITALTLKLAGNYAGGVFLAIPDGAGGTLITLAAGAAAAVPQPPPPGTATADTYVWTGGGGDWSDVTHWADTSLGPGAAAQAPGSNDLVAIAGATAANFQLLTGQGNAATLAVTANLALAGTLTTGSLSIGLPTAGLPTGGLPTGGLPTGGAAAPGMLDILAAGTLTADSATLATGGLLLNGAGALLAVAGSLQAGPASRLTVANHALLRAGALVLAGTTLTVDATASLEIGTAGSPQPGVLTIDAGATLTSSGGLLAATLADLGTLLLTGGTTTLLGALTGAGSVTIGGGAVLTLAGGVGTATGTIRFAGPGASLRLAAPPGSASFAGTIVGFAPGASIALPTSIVTAASYSAAGANAGLLSLAGVGGATMTLRLAGTYDPAGFVTEPDGAGGSRITLAGAAPCFAAGTRIRTARGEIPVEHLEVGDLVVTLSGRGAPLKRIAWIGWRRVTLDRHPTPEAVTPIRVAAHALGPGLPHRDLRLSPDHAIYVGAAGGGAALGSLIPVRYLLNGASIRREPATGALTYFHIELARHDLLLAEGLPTETYLDTGNRAGFANAPGVARLHPEPDSDRALRIWRSQACAALLHDGPALAAARALLLDRAAALGWHRTADPALRLTADGRPLAAKIIGGQCQALLPAGATRLGLHSRSCVPAEQQADSPDHRRLGIAIADLRLDGRPVPPESADFATGWHPPEPGLRWTDGAAEFLLPKSPGPRRLDLALRPLLRYWWRAADPGQPGTVRLGTVRPETVQPRADQPRADQAGADQAGADQTGADQTGAQVSPRHRRAC